MRHMRATPDNRVRVYQAVCTNFVDFGSALGLETIAQRTGLDEETVQACCDALVNTGGLTNVGDPNAYPRWIPAVVR
jgi:hypothetical protein